MDFLDKEIIRRLLKDSRSSFLGMAKELSVSEGTIRQRVSKLQKKGIIRAFTVDLASNTNAFVEIITSSSVPTKKISDKIKSLGAVRVFEVTGRFSIVASIHADDLTKLNQLLESIRAIEGVIQTETFPVLKEY
jgi:DNA-binding Lrp family transcriptional regulator